MSKLLPLSLLAILGGCSSGYALDRLKPETALVAPQLARYGIEPSRAQCVAERLSGDLSVWQMRQLGDAAEAGGTTTGERDLLWYAGQVEDPEVATALGAALAACADSVPLPAGEIVRTDLTELPAPDVVGGYVITDLHELPAPDGTIVAKNEPAKAPRGDGPSETLRRAIAAQEAGNYETAVRLATTAAEAGEAEAMVSLGRAYEVGSGVERDPVEALKWYLLASSRNEADEEAVNRLITDLSGTMALTEIERAAGLARAWDETHGS